MITIWISVSRSQEYLWNFKKKKTRKREKKEVAQHLGQILSVSVGFIVVPRDFHFRDDSSRGLSCQDNVLFFTAVLSWWSSAFTSPCSRRERGIVSKMKVLKKKKGGREEFRPIDENFKTSLEKFLAVCLQFYRTKRLLRFYVSLMRLRLIWKLFFIIFSPRRVYSAYQSRRNVPRIILENILISVGMFNFQVIVKSVLLPLFSSSSYFWIFK